MFYYLRREVEQSNPTSKRVYLECFSVWPCQNIQFPFFPVFPYSVTVFGGKENEKESNQEKDKIDLKIQCFFTLFLLRVNGKCFGEIIL